MNSELPELRVHSRFIGFLESFLVLSGMEKACRVVSDDAIDGIKVTSLGKSRVFKIPVRAGVLVDYLSSPEVPEAARRIAFHDQSYFDFETMIFYRAEHENRLTEKEAEILICLNNAAGAVVDRQALLDDVWGYAKGVETHTLETHIYRLRQKIEKDPTRPEILITDENGYRIIVQD